MRSTRSGEENSSKKISAGDGRTQALYLGQHLITQMGEEWLIRHGKRKNLHRSHFVANDRFVVGQ
jgi:hypothetical protein